jgi:hypothetical protein
MVEADRGEDLGLVRDRIHVSEYEEDKHTAGHRGRGFALGSGGELKSVLRLATMEERSLISEKVAEEEVTLQVCREKALERGLPMNIVDAEYQYDRHKLTIYFESNRRVDFRDLVSDMFALYKTRIWMAQVDMASAALDIGETISMTAGFLPLPSERLQDPSAMLLPSSHVILGSPLRKLQGGGLGYPNPPGSIYFKNQNSGDLRLDEKCESALNFDDEFWTFK